MTILERILRLRFRDRFLSICVCAALRNAEMDGLIKSKFNSTL
jgi:hypothetical protein